MFRYFLFLTIFLFIQFKPVASQDIGSWQATTSLLTVNDLIYDVNGTVWGITEGGIFRWREDSGFDILTPINGLYRLSPSALAYDQESGLIWLGFNDGTLQSFNPETYAFRSMSDIRRNQNFASRGINRIQIEEGVLYVATNFGLVLIDPERRLVIDSYVNLGRFERATDVFDIALDGSVIYLATSLGIAAANTETGNLIEPGAWDNSDGQGNLGVLNAPVNTIVYFNNSLYAGLENGNQRFNGQSWVNSGLFSGVVSNFRVSRQGDYLVSISNNAITVVSTDESTQTIPLTEGAQFRSAFLINSGNTLELFAGSRSTGLLSYPTLQSEPTVLRPAGPDLNFFTDIKINNEDIISASTRAPGRFGLSLDFSGYFIQREGQWVGFDRSNNATLSQANFNSTFVSAITNEHYFFGTWGRGIAKHEKATDDITIYNADNSPLEAVLSSETFVVVSGLDSDQEGNLWAITFQSPSRGLYSFTPSTREWESFSYPSPVMGGTFFLNLMVDRFNQMWIGLTDASEIGRGLLVWDPTIEEGPQAVRLTSTQTDGNLPDEKVNVTIQDRRGEVWIGTNRGVARFLFPDRVIRGNSQDRQASFLINADTSAASPFLLRDVHVTSMAVNAANQKWVGTLNDGIWLIDENGRNVLKHFTTENSPLFSNNITGIGVDDATGDVLIATSVGLLTYRDVVKRESRTMDELTIFPNPYSYNRNTGSVFIDGLTEETTLSIITVDGRLIERLETRGGRVEWDARDASGRRLASGVYLIVANDTQGNEKGVGKIVIIR